MDILTAVSIIALAGLTHASFQLSVSLATSLSGHALGRKLAARRTLRLILDFLLGAILMIFTATAAVGYIFNNFAFGDAGLPIAILLLIDGVLIWVFYYRRGDGTELWIPRGLAHFLRKRTAKTRMPAEAFALGIVSVVAEIPFTIAPTLAAVYAISALSAPWQVVGVAGYTLIASFGLIIVTSLLGGGKQLSQIQRWRERNKRFLQFAAGCGLIILGAYIFANSAANLILEGVIL